MKLIFFAAAIVTFLLVGCAHQTATQAKAPDPRETDQCFTQESLTTAYVVTLRESGLTKEQFVDRVAMKQQNLSLRQRILDQGDDVYGNPELNALTLRMFRTAKCHVEIGRGAQSYRDSIRADLLACQNKANGVVPELSPCLIDAIDANVVSGG
ncbi:hypothetical protein [Lysobacter sp. A289]